MGNCENKPCPFCNSDALITKYINSKFVECPACGNYEIDDFASISIDTYPDEDMLASYFYYNGFLNKPINDERYFGVIGSNDFFSKIHSEYSWCMHVTKAVVENWYPKTFSEKVDMFLLGLAARLNFLSEPIIFSNEQYISACFATRHPKGPMGTHPDAVNEQVNFLLGYMEKQEYIKSNGSRCALLPKGIERIDNLQKNSSKNTKNVFVAMSFAPEMTDIREAIKLAISDCGYIPRIMDEIEHNHQIVPEMLYEIRESRFVIAELTGHNNGAYFEAGYALGYGKDVIQVCEKSKFGEDGHFDVKQVNTVMWETTEDLRKKLVARIKATIS